MNISSGNNYHPFSAVLLSLAVFFIPLLFLYFVLGIVYGLDDSDTLKNLLQQNEVSLNSYGTDILIYPIEDNVMYLLSVPLQVLFISWLLRRKSIDPVHSLGLNFFDRKAFIYALILWILYFAFASLYGYVFEIEMPSDFFEYSKAVPVWMISIVFIIGAPIAEELLFRGYLYSQLKNTKLGISGAIFLTSLLWTALHAQYDIDILFSLFFLGLVLGYVRYKYNSVYLAIAIHAIHNIQATIYILFFT
ncbi:MAG: CPBP family intramembrane metalloprotease [Proteobacteria bacterium]|nr:CPBP family intramembrane metalloprotease [Pseudomonadota bacterium]